MSTTMIPEKQKAKRAKSKTSAKKQVKRNGAVAKAWAIFGKHPKAERKDAVQAAVKAGVNPNTAKTQFQKWMHRNEK